jgi:hypothetical protein
MREYRKIIFGKNFLSVDDIYFSVENRNIPKTESGLIMIYRGYVFARTNRYSGFDKKYIDAEKYQQVILICMLWSFYQTFTQNGFVDDAYNLVSEICKKLTIKIVIDKLW